MVWCFMNQLTKEELEVISDALKIRSIALYDDIMNAAKCIESGGVDQQESMTKNIRELNKTGVVAAKIRLRLNQEAPNEEKETIPEF